MKLRLVYALLFGALTLIVFLGNKNGRASEAKAGNTGAPGDESNFNGSPRTCTYCHFGAAGPVVYIHLLDSDGDTITEYVPGQQYKARVAIDNNNPLLTGFGFQMIALRNSDSTDLDGFSDPGNNTVNNYKLATITNGRTYAEHDNISDSSLFNVNWKAPPTGTGSVTFYAAGNAVNRNGTNSGDGADHHLLQISEAIQAGVADPDISTIPLSVSPNPALHSTRLQIQLVQAGGYLLSAYDLNGRLQWSAMQNLEAGQNTLDLPVSSWLSGMYLIQVSDGRRTGVVKFLKL